jgi:hypothetical protein
MGQLVRVVDFAVSVRVESGTETITAAATLLDNRERREVTASTTDLDDLYPRLLAASHR